MGVGGRGWVPNTAIPYTKKWKIPKYHVENERNTDTAFMIGDAYLMFYPSRVFFSSELVYTRNEPPP